VAYLYDNRHAVPLLVVFANKLLKMARAFYEDIDETQKYHALSNFFELFFAVADSGPEMRRYMVRQKFVGALLDIFCDKESTNKHYTRDLAYLPMYERVLNKKPEVSSKVITDLNDSIELEDTDFDFGLRFQKPKRSKDDLVVEKDKNKLDKNASDDEGVIEPTLLKGSKESDDKRYGYLVRTLSALVCSCKFRTTDGVIGLDSKFLNSPNPSDVPDVEERVIDDLSSVATMKSLLMMREFNVGTRESLNAMYSHLCWENEAVSNRLLKLLVAELCSDHCGFVTVIRHTPLVVTLSKISDRLAQARMIYLMQNLFEKTFASEHSTYIKYSDSLLNLVRKVASRNYYACKYLREADGAFDVVKKFHDKNPIPKATGSSQVLFRGLNYDRFDRLLSEDDKKLLWDYSEQRLLAFQNLLVDVDWEDHIEVTIKQEQDDDCQAIVFAAGDRVDYFKEEYKSWIEAEVIEDYGPIMQVSYRVPQYIVLYDRVDERKNSVKINKDSVRTAGVYTRDM